MPVESGTENEAPQRESQAPQPAGIVERLVRDDSDRKRFLKMAGSAGAASFGAFVLAACGSSSSSSTTATSGRAGEHGNDRVVERQHGRHRHPQLRAHARVPGDRVLRKVDRGRSCSAARSEPDQGLRRPGGHTRGRAERRGRSARWNPGGEAGRQIPDHHRGSDAPNSPTPSRTSAPRPISVRRPIQSPQVLASALAIHTVEARHAATLGTLVKKSVTPDGAFAKPADMSTVLAAVKPFLA